MMSIHTRKWKYIINLAEFNEAPVKVELIIEDLFSDFTKNFQVKGYSVNTDVNEATMNNNRTLAEAWNMAAV